MQRPLYRQIVSWTETQYAPFTSRAHSRAIAYMIQVSRHASTFCSPCQPGEIMARTRWWRAANSSL